MSCAAQQPLARTLTEVVRCPLCRSSHQKNIARHERQSLRKCLNCGVRFLFPQPSLVDLSERFQGASVPGHLKFDSEFNREKVLGKVAQHIKALKPAGRIVDLGCATGFFLSRFFPKSEWDVRGVEVSNWSAERAERRGVLVSRGTIQQALLDESSIDVVSVLDAFYYFPSPQLELAEFRRILKSDGVLAIEMPVAASRILRLSGRLGEWIGATKGPMLANTDHLFYYGPKSIRRLLEQCGFRIVKMISLPPNRQTNAIRNLLYRSYRVCAWGLQVLTHSKIFLGPRFLILAQKT